MSIIHDALKKVQQTSPSRAPAAPPAHPPQAPAKEQDNINIPLFVAAGCAIIAMIFAALPQLTPRKTPTLLSVPAPRSAAAPEPATPAAAMPSPTTPSSSVSSAVAAAVTAPSLPAPAPAPAKAIDPNDPFGNIQIEGVMDMGGKKAVLINGNVYEEGQTIHGRIITEVTFETLTIIDNGQKRTFPIKP